MSNPKLAPARVFGDVSMDGFQRAAAHGLLATLEAPRGGGGNVGCVLSGFIGSRPLQSHWWWALTTAHNVGLQQAARTCWAVGAGSCASVGNSVGGRAKRGHSGSAGRGGG